MCLQDEHGILFGFHEHDPLAIAHSFLFAGRDLGNAHLAYQAFNEAGPKLDGAQFREELASELLAVGTVVPIEPRARRSSTVSRAGHAYLRAEDKDSGNPVSLRCWMCSDIARTHAGHKVKRVCYYCECTKSKGMCTTCYAEHLASLAA